MGDAWLVNSQETLENFIHYLRSEYDRNGYAMVKIESNKKRSLSQNSALHLYCNWLAESLNDAGLDMLKVFDEGADIPWTGVSVKEHLWRPVQNAITSKTSTTEVSKAEYIDIYKALDRHIASKFGVHVEWPSRDM